MRIVAETSEAIMFTDANANILSVNQAFQNITGYSAEDVLGKNTRILNSGVHDKQYFTNMWQALLSVGSWRGEISSKRKNGEIYQKLLAVTAIKNRLGNTIEYVAKFSDETEKKVLEERFQYLAMYDLRTNLGNERLLLDRFDNAIATNACNHTYAALLFIGLDNFRILNGAKGRKVGNLLLVQVAQHLQACMRDTDTIIRFGGDEFVVLLEGLSDDETLATMQARVVGEKVLKAINKPYMLNNNEYHCSSSIGITLVANSKLTFDDLIKQADMAMNEAKKAGGNTLRFFDTAM